MTGWLQHLTQKKRKCKRVRTRWWERISSFWMREVHLNYKMLEPACHSDKTLFLIMLDWIQQMPALYVLTCVQTYLHSATSLLFWCLRRGKIYLHHRAHICLQYRDRSWNAIFGKISYSLWEPYETYKYFMKKHSVHFSVVYD